MGAAEMALLRELGVAELPAEIGVAMLRVGAAHYAATLAASRSEDGDLTESAFDGAIRNLARAILARERARLRVVRPS
jgi:hypothetical protein